MKACLGIDDKIPETDDCPSVKICPDGTYKPESDHCGGLELCPNGLPFDEYDGCVATTQEVCNARGAIIVGDRCQPCPADRPVGDGDVCRTPTSSDYEEERRLGEERNGRLGFTHAHRSGYEGQGTTIAIVEVDRMPYNPSELGKNLRFAPESLSPTASGMFDAIDVSLRARPILFSNLYSFESHAVWVAGVAGAPRNGVGTHGVAPRSVLLPLLAGTSAEDARKLAAYVAASGIPIVNNSYSFSIIGGSGTLDGYGTENFEIALDVFSLLVGTRDDYTVDLRESLGKEEFKTEAREISEGLGDSDAVFVWSAGNSRLNGNSGRRFTFRGERTTVTLTLQEMYDKFTSDRYGRLRPATVTGAVILPSTDAQYPLMQGDLEDNWLAAVAVEVDSRRGLTIAGFSDGCGPAKMWCIAADGKDIAVPGYPAVYHYDPAVDEVDGTSFAAPIVSGALAVLRSAAPEIGMEAIRGILLTSATDIGEPGVDELFGWGYVNVSAGIDMIEGMEVESMGGMFQSLGYAELRGSLPAGFDGLHEGLEDVDVAVKITDDLYANVPLSRMLAVAEEEGVPLGGAASDLDASPFRPALPGFSAFADSDARRYALSWQGAAGGGNVWAEVSRYAEEGSVMGASFGSLGSASSEVYGGRLRFNRPLSEDLRMFGEYDYRAIEAETGGFIAGIEGARAEGGELGVSWRGVLRSGDKLLASARREPSLSGGRMVVSYPHAVGSLTRALHGEVQELEARRRELPLRRRTPTVWTLGYARPWGSRKSEWSMAAEYEDVSGQGALSAEWRVKF